MAGEAAAVSPSTVHVAISRYVPTQYLQVPTTCCYLSPGTKNTQLLAFSFLVNLTFSASLRSCERMWRQPPSNPEPLLRSNVFCSCFKIFNISPEGGRISFVHSSIYSILPLKVVETSSVSYEDVLATTVINKVGVPSRNILPSESSCSCLVVWHQLVGTKLVLI